MQIVKSISRFYNKNNIWGNLLLLFLVIILIKCIVNRSKPLIETFDLNKRYTIKEGLDVEVEITEPPKPLAENEAMKIVDVLMQPYVKEPEQDIFLRIQKNNRFTMRDIGRLENRIERLEDYTTLNLLEAETENFQVLDANGFDRFKSGFVVDNFSGHRIGDVKNKDYKCAIDQENKELRAKCVMRAASLEETVSILLTIVSLPALLLSIRDATTPDHCVSQEFQIVPNLFSFAANTAS